MFVPPDPKRRPRMVRWFSIGQLARTGFHVFVSSIFGRHADFRLIAALATREEGREAPIYDLSGREEGFWIDYVADTGDGWNSTYAVAYWLSRPTLPLHPGAGEGTASADLLVFGGDLVYPMASRAEYLHRLIEPFTTARPESPDPAPAVFAVPGNHDWYDSLAAFTRIFCGGRRFAGWQTQQQRSYFALRLPHRWWLLGVDMQLGSDIDQHQEEYFRKAAALMAEGDHVILCVAHPEWVYATRYGEMDPELSERNLRYIEEVILAGRKVKVFLSGDLHHYRRHEAPEADNPSQKITAGGGGAFLHPTHDLPSDTLVDGYVLREAFPDAHTSRRLAWRNLLFPLLNPRFGLLTAITYLLVAWLPLVTQISGCYFQHGLHTWDQWIYDMLTQPFQLFLLLLTFLGFYIFTDTHSGWYRRLMGTAHWGLHQLSILGLIYVVLQVVQPHCESGLQPVPTILVSGFFVFIGGWVVGSFNLGLYLLISMNVFRRHSNESFSSLAIEDWKNFVRLHIDGKGDLTVYPYGIARVPRRWRDNVTAGPGDALLLPDDAQATDPALIEPPLRIRGPESGKT